MRFSIQFTDGQMAAVEARNDPDARPWWSVTMNGVDWRLNTAAIRALRQIDELVPAVSGPSEPVPPPVVDPPVPEGAPPGGTPAPKGWPKRKAAPKA